jgi:hypothetical protein
LGRAFFRVRWCHGGLLGLLGCGSGHSRVFVWWESRQIGGKDSSLMWVLVLSSPKGGGMSCRSLVGGNSSVGGESLGGSITARCFPFLVSLSLSTACVVCSRSSFVLSRRCRWKASLSSNVGRGVSGMGVCSSSILSYCVDEVGIPFAF